MTEIQGKLWPSKMPTDATVVEKKYAGLNIRSASMIDTSYFYIGLVLGCIDADLCK